MALRLGNNQTDSEKYLRSFESSFRLYTFHSKKNEYPPRDTLQGPYLKLSRSSSELTGVYLADENQALSRGLMTWLPGSQPSAKCLERQMCTIFFLPGP